MRLIVFILFPSFFHSSGAQVLKSEARIQKNSRFSYADYPETLAAELSKDCRSDKEKVSAFFSWIVNNIDYNVAPFGGFNYYRYGANDEVDERYDTCELDIRVAAIVLKRRTALCDGYARLFKALCDISGIQSEVITGYGRTGTAKQFKCNHKWNAVYFESEWHLLDATWSSGYISYNNQFVRNTNYQYFLSSPQQFITDHYPDDPKWTLLNNYALPREYNHSPFKNDAFSKYRITGYQPQKGIIDAKLGDSILIEVETQAQVKSLRITDTLGIDSLVLSSTGCDDNKPVNYADGKKIFAYYFVESQQPQWLQVIYNNEVIMRYKLNIRSPKAEPSIEVAKY